VDWVQSFLNDFDGYTPIAENLHEGLREELRAELKSAEPVPEGWGFVGSVSGGYGDLWEKPGEIETKTPPVQELHSELIPEPFRHWLADVSHRMQTPPDFSAISSIVIVGSILGAGVVSRLSHKNFTCLNIDSRVETESANFLWQLENFSTMSF